MSAGTPLPNPDKLISELEQYEGFLVNLAQIFTTFHKTLVEDGISPQVADSMTFQYFDTYVLHPNRRV